MTVINESIKQRIIEVANALVSEGIESPTNNEVRERLGGGSLSHISPVMRGWRDGRREQISTALEIPADLKKMIETALSQVWNTSNSIAFSMIETVKMESENAVQESGIERDEALHEVGVLEEKLQRAEQDNRDLVKKIESKDFEIGKLQSDKIMLETEKIGLTELLEERKRQIEGLQQNASSLQQELISIARDRT